MDIYGNFMKTAILAENKTLLGPSLSRALCRTTNASVNCHNNTGLAGLKARQLGRSGNCLRPNHFLGTQVTALIAQELAFLLSYKPHG